MRNTSCFAEQREGLTAANSKQARDHLKTSLCQSNGDPDPCSSVHDLLAMALALASAEAPARPWEAASAVAWARADADPLPDACAAARACAMASAFPAAVAWAVA